MIVKHTLKKLAQLREKYKKEKFVEVKMKVYDVNFIAQCKKVNRALAAFKKYHTNYFNSDNQTNKEGIV